MSVAYVLITCELGKEEEVIEKLKEIEQIKFVDELYGAYDLLVKVEDGDPVQLGETISWKVKAVPNIRSTMTLNRKDN